MIGVAAADEVLKVATRRHLHDQHEEYSGSTIAQYKHRELVYTVQKLCEAISPAGLALVG